MRRSFSERWRLAMAAVAAAVIMAVFAGAGCGQSDEDEIRGVVLDVQEAFASNDLRAACGLTTRAAQAHVGWAGHDEPPGCVRRLRKLAAYFPVGALRVNPLPDVVAVRVDGDRAVARLRRRGGWTARVPLVRQDGAWKLAALYGGIPAGRQDDRYR